MVNVGIDLHKTQFTICVRGKKGNEFDKYPTTEEGYASFLKKVSLWQKKGEKVRVGVESTGNTRYFKNRMEEAKVEVIVINTLKLKVVNESVKKTDKHDAATIAEFLEKDMLPEAQLCSRESEQIRRLLKVRTTLVRSCVVIKNQIHALLTAEGFEDIKGSLQSKKGRQKALDTLSQWKNGLVAQPLVQTIDNLCENIKRIEDEIRKLVEGDRVVELLMTIPGCGEICAWTIRAYLDDINRFSSPKKFVSFAGLAPWVQNSNETIRHGRITKRGPQELRTALVQVVMGMRRMKKTTLAWRLMQRHEVLKKSKGSGKSIIATARKVATIIWHMLIEDVCFDVSKMAVGKPAEKTEQVCETTKMACDALEESKEKSVEVRIKNMSKKISGVSGKKLRKVG
jgi:transposase